MRYTNVVLKLNVKGPGYSLFWLADNPTLSNDEVEKYLPQTEETIFGPGIAFSSNRLSNGSYFLCITSRWNIKDEYGRDGLSLSQGVLLKAPENIEQLAEELCSTFITLLKLHRQGYNTLSGILSTIATQGSEERVRALAAKLDTSNNRTLDKSTYKLIVKLYDKLKKQLEEQNEKIRVYTGFPWSEELGFCALLEMQAHSTAVTSIGGGQLLSYDHYQYISAVQDIPDYNYIDLSSVLKGKHISDPKQSLYSRAKGLFKKSSSGQVEQAQDDLGASGQGILYRSDRRGRKIAAILAYIIGVPLALTVAAIAVLYHLLIITNPLFIVAALGVWLVLPPLWFWFEYVALFDSKEYEHKFKQFIHGQYLARIAWLSVLALLLLVFFKT